MLTVRELNQVFDEYDLCNALINNLGAMTAKLLDLDTEAITILIASSKAVDKESLKPVM